MKNSEFACHVLNEHGKRRAKDIQEIFDCCLNNLKPLCEPHGREFSIVRTKLEEACCFAKTSMAINLINQECNRTHG